MFDSPAKRPFFFVFNRNPPLIASPTLCHITPHSLIPLPPYPPAADIVHCSVHYLTHCVGVDPPACPPVGASFCCRCKFTAHKSDATSVWTRAHGTHIPTHTHTHTHIMPRALGSRRTTWPQVSGLVGLGTRATV